MNKAEQLKYIAIIMLFLILYGVAGGIELGAI